jgi:hypothetical protein
LIDTYERELALGRSCRFDPELLSTESYIPDCGPTFTSALLAVSPFDENVRIGTKHWKWRKIVEAGGRGVHIPMPLFYYRMHEDNLSGIGSRILCEAKSGKIRERLLSGYWGRSTAN